MYYSTEKQFLIKNRNLKIALIKTLYQELKYQWRIVRTTPLKFHQNGKPDTAIKEKAKKRIKQIGYEISQRQKAEKSLTEKGIK